MSDQQFRYHTYQPSRRSVAQAQPIRRSRRRMSFVFVAGVIVAFYGVFSFTTHLSLLTKGSSVQASSTPTPQPLPTSLHQSLGAIIAAHPNSQIGIALENIQSGELQTYGIDAPFDAASTAKLITACAYYHLVETGQASLATELGDYTAGFQIKAMVNQSSNDSWDLLVDVIGKSQLESYAKSNGIAYEVDGNTLSPASMATLLGKLYSGKLLNKADTQQLLSYMQQTNDEALIPAAVDSTITVYHKYGLLDGELHDAAILTDGNRSYALVIYTKGADDSDDAQRTTTIHQLTQTIVSAVFGKES